VEKMKQTKKTIKFLKNTKKNAAVKSTAASKNPTKGLRKVKKQRDEEDEQDMIVESTPQFINLKNPTNNKNVTISNIKGAKSKNEGSVKRLFVFVIIFCSL
jgi:hypothetical protein